MVERYNIMDFFEFEEKVKEFSFTFVKNEYNLWKLAYTEENSELFWSERDKFILQFYSDGMETDVRRRKNIDKEWLITAKEYLEAIQERKIFQIKIYKNIKYDYIASLYLSSKHSGGNNYFEMLILGLKNDSIKIISSFLTDNEGYFDYHDGIEFDELPNPIKIIKFQTPDDPADLEEYLSE
jgi:hypothetical protein